MATKLNLTKEQLDDILNQYISGISPRDIERQYGLKNSTISYLRKKHKIPKYKDPKYSNENISQAVNDLTSGILLKDVMKKYGLSEGVISRYMNDNNIYYKSDHGRKNHFNKQYFDVINSEQKAYWLGFIYADGCIAKSDKTQTRANRLIINLSIKDKIILEDFLMSINAYNIKIQEFIPKGTYSSNSMCRIYLNSVELCDALQRLGVFENKTGNTKFPKLYQVPEKFHSHFIRGFFDGDGCITTGPSFSIIGNKEMLDPIQKILMQNCSLNKTKFYNYPHKDNNVFDLTYGGKLQCARIKDYLYKDATIYLTRKLDKFNTLLS